MIEITLHTTYYDILIVVPLNCRTLGGNTLMNLIIFLDEEIYWVKYHYRNALKGDLKI